LYGEVWDRWAPSQAGRAGWEAMLSVTERGSGDSMDSLQRATGDAGTCWGLRVRNIKVERSQRVCNKVRTWLYLPR